MTPELQREAQTLIDSSIHDSSNTWEWHARELLIKMLPALKDAKRYRWLRDAEPSNFPIKIIAKDIYRTSDEVDAAIDAAIFEQSKCP